MSDVVLDASFVVKLLVEETGSRLCKSVFEAYEGSRFLVPGHSYAEIIEVLRRKVVKKMVTPEQLIEATEILPSLAEDVAILQLLRSAASIAVSQSVTIYDAIYVALADARSAVLITADIKLARKLQGGPFQDLILGIDDVGLIHFGRG